MNIPILHSPSRSALEKRVNHADEPRLVRQGYAPGNGPKTLLQLKTEQDGVYAEESSARAAADLSTVKWVGEVLHSHYRGHLWAALVDSHQGICTITIPVLLGNWKYKIPLQHLTPAAVIKAGGEILERFNIPRSNIDVAAFVAARPLAVSRYSQKPPGGVVRR